MPDDRREQIGWYFYDWANSAFSTTVVTVFLGPYLTTVAGAAADADGFIFPFGLRINAGSFFPYTVSLSVMLQVLILPILGAIADFSHLKKQMLGFFAYLGAFCTMGLYFLQGTNYALGGALFVAANLCFGASIVFYNAFLPEIARPEDRDAVSSGGWALGYLGGGVLLFLNLAMFYQAGALGLTAEQAVRISLVSAGVWWGVFTILPMKALRSREPRRRLPSGETYLTAGFHQLRQTLRRIRGKPQTMLFLAAYLIYNDGIQTVITLTSQFGQEELNMTMGALTGAILMVQFVAAFGALLFARLAGRFGALQAIILSLLIWSAGLIYAYGFMRTPFEFFILAAVIALVLGGSQALSRSVFSRMIPKGREAEYFSLYEVSERGTSWLGPLLFGLSLQFTHSYRIALLSLIFFFIIGMILLIRLDLGEAVREAGREDEGAAAD